MQDNLLKRTFLIDALACLGSAALLIGGAAMLSEPFDLSEGFLTAAGALLVPVAILFLWIARTGSRPLALLGIVGNLGWVAASAAVIPILQPTALGAIFVVAQAAAVLALAWFEYQGSKQLSRTA